MPRVSVHQAQEVADAALARAGVPADNAAVQRDVLLEAELRGFASHGLLRLPRLIERIRNGVADPLATGAHQWRSHAFLSVDGERGLGPVVAMRALAAAGDRAKSQGVALAAISNSNHIGMLAYYAEHCVSLGQSVIALTTSEALVHPWGGRRAMIGTNPIAIGVPTGGEPFVMDTATSVVAMGRIHDHANRGEPIPPDWALDEEGNPTTDPERAKHGAIAPFGGAKGFALGLAFELLVSSLTGAALGTGVRGTLDSTEVCNKGDVFIIIDGPAGRLVDYLDAIRAEQPAAGFEAVRIPGERGRASRRTTLERGLSVADEVWNRIIDMAA
ncbi:MAG TPA: Ldh family oxidoreductase [Devosiaceae bacterium]|nr:Ldh family oxidoreductase [Devosiaceae bacterium]